MAPHFELNPADSTSPTSASRNARQPPEESGPFGRNRGTRYTGSRTSRTRTGTTPIRQKEDPAVAEFGRLFAKEQAKKENTPAANTSSSETSAPLTEPSAVATECLLYGYASKSSEWKVLSKYERIVAPGIICEDYPREDPNLYLSSNSPYAYSKSAIVVHKSLTKDALRKSRVYKGGEHWIKITFDSLQAAEKACFYSPIEIDGYMVFCEMWQGKPPFADTPLLKGSDGANQMQRGAKMRTLTTSQSTNLLSGRQSAVEGFERAFQSQTLPRSHTMPTNRFGQPSSLDDVSGTMESSPTASSATATDAQSPSSSTLAPPTQPTLRSRSQPNLLSTSTPSTTTAIDAPLKFIPSARKLVLRPMSEALPPQPSFTTKLLRSIPVVSWFVGGGTASTAEPSGIIGDGPIVKEDGTWDEQRNGFYWNFWRLIDKVVGSDFCGLKDD